MKGWSVDEPYLCLVMWHRIHYIGRVENMSKSWRFKQLLWCNLWRWPFLKFAQANLEFACAQFLNTNTHNLTSRAPHHLANCILGCVPLAQTVVKRQTWRKLKKWSFTIIQRVKPGLTHLLIEWSGGEILTLYIIGSGEERWWREEGGSRLQIDACITNMIAVCECSLWLSTQTYTRHNNYKISVEVLPICESPLLTTPSGMFFLTTALTSSRAWGCNGALKHRLCIKVTKKSSLSIVINLLFCACEAEDRILNSSHITVMPQDMSASQVQYKSRTG